MKFLEQTHDRGLRSMLFECPGCECLHVVHIAGTGHPLWAFNENIDRPTVSPSVLVQWDQWEPPASTPDMQAKLERGEFAQRRVRKVCHSFITDGCIQFLDDCTHELAGKTVELPEFEV